MDLETLSRGVDAPLLQFRLSALGAVALCAALVIVCLGHQRPRSNHTNRTVFLWITVALACLGFWQFYLSYRLSVLTAKNNDLTASKLVEKRQQDEERRN